MGSPSPHALVHPLGLGSAGRKFGLGMDFVENPHAHGTAAAEFLATLKRQEFARLSLESPTNDDELVLDEKGPVRCSDAASTRSECCPEGQFELLPGLHSCYWQGLPSSYSRQCQVPFLPECIPGRSLDAKVFWIPRLVLGHFRYLPV
jgi:hypothetical protein